MTTQVKLNGAIAHLMKGMTSNTGSNLVELREVDTEYTGILVPQLLTTLMGFSTSNRKTRAFIYDDVAETGVLPNGKAYHDKGELIGKDGYSQHTFAIPSYGIQYAINCEDYAEKRKPGTTDQFMDLSYLDEREQRKVMKAFDLLSELNAGSLLTSDTPNFLDGGLITPPNFYTELVGGARPAATPVDFTALASLGEYRDITEAAVDATEELVSTKQRSVSRYVMVCGKDFFNAVRTLEAQENLAREIRGIDLAQEGLPMMADGSFQNIRTFEGSDGIVYIKYSASILGTKLIADDDAYLIPVGMENAFVIEYAPASTLDTINKEAQPMYMWSHEDRRQASFEFESNRLYMSRIPQAITHFAGTFV